MVVVAGTVVDVVDVVVVVAGTVVDVVEVVRLRRSWLTSSTVFDRVEVC